MIDYPYAEKFEQDSIHKSLSITYDGGSISNTELQAEDFELQESICSQNELIFGCCESSYVQFSLGYEPQTLEGKELTITTTPDGGTALPLGKFKVVSDTPTADRRWRDIVAYDKLYEILNTDLADWYDSLFENTEIMTLKIFRDALFTELGVTQVSTTLINDDMLVEKTIDPKVLTGKDILLPLCEINACFGRMTRDGKFEYVYLNPPTQGLFPDTILYPQETGLYPTPNGNAQEVGKNGNYKNAIYGDYITDLITKLQIREKENDIGVIVGTGDNIYVIENNFLVYGKSTEELTPIATNIYNKIKGLYFCPATIEAAGNPCLQAGDGVKLVTKYATIETYILQRTLTGIQALQDVYVSEGSRRRDDAQKNNLNKELIQLRGKSNELERTIEQTQSTITDVEAGLQSQITQNANSITAEVTRATTQEGTITNSLNSEITRAQTREGQLSASIQAMPTSIMAQVESTYETIGNVTTKVNNAVSTAEGYTDTQLGSYYTKTETEAQILIGEGVVKTHVQNNYYNKTTVDGFVQGLQDQIDNRTTLWTVDAVPTLSNYPANQWTTDAERDTHINDLALVSSADPQHEGENYRFIKTGTTYSWNIVQDTVATQALARANEALQGVSDINTDLQTNYYTSVQTDTQITAGEGRVKSYVQQNYELTTEVTRKVNEGVSTAESYAENYTDNVLLSYTDTQTMESLIEQSADNIVAMVSTSLQKYDEESYTITLYGYGTPTASAATFVNKYYLDQMTGYLYLSDGTDWSKVDELNLISEELQTQITQNATAITTKVSNGEISSKLSQEAGQITISANRLVIDSTGFKLDANGKAQFISNDATNRFVINDVSDQTSNYVIRVQKYKDWSEEGETPQEDSWADSFNVDKDGSVNCKKITCNNLYVNRYRPEGSSYLYGGLVSCYTLMVKELRASYSTIEFPSTVKFGSSVTFDNSIMPTTFQCPVVFASGSITIDYSSVYRFECKRDAVFSNSSTTFSGTGTVSFSKSTTFSSTVSFGTGSTVTFSGTTNFSTSVKFNGSSNSVTFEGNVTFSKAPTFSVAPTFSSGLKVSALNNTSGNTLIKANNTYGVTIGSSTSYSNPLGFFGSTGNSKQTVNKLSSSATLAQTVTKVNDLLTALKNYGLITSS